jgi:nucleoside-diphosphate-sugar epimerase
MRVVVTGGLGTIGRRLLPELLEAGHEVTCFEVPTRANQRAGRHFSGVRMQFGDIRSPEEVGAVLRGPGACEAVIHLAAILPPLAETLPERAQDVNVGGTRVLLDAMAKLRRPRSSSSPRRSP